jgi:hypothetical protein
MAFGRSARLDREAAHDKASQKRCDIGARDAYADRVRRLQFVDRLSRIVGCEPSTCEAWLRGDPVPPTIATALRDARESLREPRVTA